MASMNAPCRNNKRCSYGLFHDGFVVAYAYGFGRLQHVPWIARSHRKQVDDGHPIVTPSLAETDALSDRWVILSANISFGC